MPLAALHSNARRARSARSRGACTTCGTLWPSTGPGARRSRPRHRLLLVSAAGRGRRTRTVLSSPELKSLVPESLSATQLMSPLCPCEASRRRRRWWWCVCCLHDGAVHHHGKAARISDGGGLNTACPRRCPHPQTHGALQLHPANQPGPCPPHPTPTQTYCEHLPDGGPVRQQVPPSALETRRLRQPPHRDGLVACAPIHKHDATALQNPGATPARRGVCNLSGRKSSGGKSP